MRLFTYLALIFFISFFASLFYWNFYTPQEIAFSDGAHYAVIARQFFQTKNWSDLYSFFGPAVFYNLQTDNTFTASVLPLTPFTIWISFSLFGVSDFTAILPGILFFAATSCLIAFYLQRRKGYSIAFLGALIFSFSTHFLDYATSAATETLFTFLLVIAFILVSSKSIKYRLLSIPVILLTLFARPHAPFYLPAFFGVFFLSLNSKHKKLTLIIFAALFVASIPFWSLLSARVPYLNLLGQSQILFANSPLMPANTALRSGAQAFAFSLLANIKVLAAKIFYNSYNLVKLIPRFLPPYLIPFFALSFVIKNSQKRLLMFVAVGGIINLLAVSASVPSFRYLHPLFPFIIILGIDAFAHVTSKMQLPKLSTISVALLLFILLPLSSLILDARFQANTHNVGQPSAAKVLGSKLKDITPPGTVIITNLDVWGSWFGNRTTIWFPLTPTLISDASARAANPVDYIYITNYRADDENMFVGPGWRELLNDPPQIIDPFLKQYYRIKTRLTVEPADNYDNLPLTAVLLERI